MRLSADRSIGRRTAAALAAAVTGVLMVLPVSGPAGADTSSVPLVWSTLSPPSSPPPLAYSAAAYDSDTRTLVLFGGVAPSGALSNNTWVWNGSTWRSYAGSQIVAPEARELAAMAFDPVLHQLVLFGGRVTGGELVGDTWAWNGASWYQVPQRLSGQSPSPREGAAMAYDGHGNLVLFGGDGPSSGAGSASGTTSGPSKPGIGSQAGGSGLTSTSGTSASSAPATATLGDTWLWTSAGWAASAAAGPAARTVSSMTYYSDGGSAVMFGGSSAPVASRSPGYLSDTWTWNGSSWSSLPGPATPGGAGATPVTAPAGSVPGPRSGAAAADDPPAGGAVLFGGVGPTGFLSDTWLWNGRAWSTAGASGNPGSRAGSGSAFDVAAQQLVLFGGTGKANDQTGPADASGNYGSTLGGGGAVLGGTSVLTAGAPVGLGTPPAAIPGLRSSAPATSLPPPGASQESALPGASGAAPTTAAGTPAPAHPTATPLQVLHRGQVVTLRGSGFVARTKVTLTFHSTPVVVGTTTSDLAGDFEITVAVPQSAPIGTHRFVASGEGPKGQMQLLIATVRVVTGNGVSSGRATTEERLALIGLALALPLGTWLAMGAFGRWRRRGFAGR